jgi:hypothetical protein
MSSPIKQVPLASGSDDEPRIGHPTVRAFFCGVVVEGAGDGELAQGECNSGFGEFSLYLLADVQELVASLGEPMPAQDMPYLPRSTSAPATTGSLASLVNPPTSAPMSRSLSADAAVLSEVITELVTTERSYLKRLSMLKCVSTLLVSMPTTAHYLLFLVIRRPSTLLCKDQRYFYHRCLRCKNIVRQY